LSKEEIIAILKSIKPHFQNKGIITLALFGSFNTNSSTIYSGIDIAIKKDQNFVEKYGVYAYFDTIHELKSLLRKKLKREIDILDLDSSSPFLEEIKKDLTYV